MPKYNDMLIYIRKSHNLTQDEAAKAIGISRSSLANYERGFREPSFEVMEAIADYYNVNLDLLFGRVSEAYPYSEKDIKILNAIKSLSPESQDDVLKIISLVKGMNGAQRDLWVKMVSALLK